MSKRAEEKAKVFGNSLNYYQSMEMWPEEAFQKGYEQAEKDIIAIIESRIAEILGDAQPKPTIRIELKELITRIKEANEMKTQELTWEDMKAIVEIADDLLPDPRYKKDLDASLQSEEAYYKEVLKRFNDGRKDTETGIVRD